MQLLQLFNNGGMHSAIGTGWVTVGGGVGAAVGEGVLAVDMLCVDGVSLHGLRRLMVYI